MGDIMRRLRLTCTIKSLLIFAGIILMQFLAAFIYISVYIFLKAVQGESYDILQDGISPIGTSSLMWISAISASLSMVWCLILYLRSDWRVKGMDYRKVFTIKNISGILGTGAGGCVVLTIFLSLVMNIIPSAFESYNELMKNLDPGSGILTIIYVVFVGPVSEEVIFRGAIFDRMRLAYGFWAGNILQALFFGIYHMNFIQGLYAFLLGVVLGMVIYATGSIICSIATHIIFNATTYIIQSVFTENSPFMGMLFLAVAIISLVMFISGLYYFINQCRYKCNAEKV